MIEKPKLSGFGNRRVLSLESRRAREMAQLIANNGGEPIVAPSTREVQTEDHGDARKFVTGLKDGNVDIVIFLTGVGARALASAVEEVCPLEELIRALSRITVIARGPKPVAVLREWGVPIAAVVPEPNTWRELLDLLDQKKDLIPLKGRSVAVQEYGASSPDLLAGLAERGAQVTPIRVYEWSLPEDTGPLRQAVLAISRGEIDVLLVTSAVQIRHLLQIAEEMKMKDEVVRTLGRTVVGSIGPVASAALKDLGIPVDMEPSHPKMGFLVKEAAEQCGKLAESKQLRTP
jgi:uroporphyrinogen-III synthase